MSVIQICMYSQKYDDYNNNEKHLKVNGRFQILILEYYKTNILKLVKMISVI